MGFLQAMGSCKHKTCCVEAQELARRICNGEEDCPKLALSLAFGCTFGVGQDRVGKDRGQRSIDQEAAANTSAVGLNAHVSRLPIRSLLYPGATTKIYVRVMPWFGDSKHVQVGYRSDDAGQVSSQVQDMMSRGIDAAIVDWYGPDHGVSSQSTDLLFRESQARGFGFGISVDGGPLKECMKKGCDLTGFLLSELRYAEQNYERSNVYVRWHDRPLVFFFDGEKYPVDWDQHSLQPSYESAVHLPQLRRVR